MAAYMKRFHIGYAELKRMIYNKEVESRKTEGRKSSKRCARTYIEIVV